MRTDSSQRPWTRNQIFFSYTNTNAANKAGISSINDKFHPPTRLEHGLRGHRLKEKKEKKKKPTKNLSNF